MKGLAGKIRYCAERACPVSRKGVHVTLRKAARWSHWRDHEPPHSNYVGICISREGFCFKPVAPQGDRIRVSGVGARKSVF